MGRGGRCWEEARCEAGLGRGRWGASTSCCYGAAIVSTGQGTGSEVALTLPSPTVKQSADNNVSFPVVHAMASCPKQFYLSVAAGRTPCLMDRGQRWGTRGWQCRLPCPICPFHTTACPRSWLHMLAHDFRPQLCLQEPVRQSLLLSMEQHWELLLRAGHTDTRRW